MAWKTTGAPIVRLDHPLAVAAIAALVVTVATATADGSLPVVLVSVLGTAHASRPVIAATPAVLGVLRAAVLLVAVHPVLMNKAGDALAVDKKRYASVKRNLPAFPPPFPSFLK
ncbi:hypothetical protein BX666DRAFT_1924282 [Dichotomocladium elegans]|nr:hypothetical protein BX666DRAFT_1924282 [Dichotomocladium elegans]